MVYRQVLVVACLIVCLLAVVPAEATTVMGNSKDWQDLYLAAMYAHLNDYEFSFIESLGDAEIQTQLLDKTEPLIIIESESRPVIKNYESFLSVGGYESVTVITAPDYTELQAELFTDAEQYVALDPRFGMEAVAAAPLILHRSWAPLFLNAESKERVQQLLSADSLIVGHYPYRVVDGVPGERLDAYPTENALTLALRAQKETDATWGMIGRADEFEPGALGSGLPVFIFAEEIEPVADAVRESGIQRFEVIGADLADVAKSIEAQSGRDLHLLLKYGQTVTNLPGLEGRILSLRQVPTPYPAPGLAVEEAVYYPSLNTLAVTFTNPATLETKFFSNLELGDLVFSDEHIHTIGPGDDVVIPYTVAAEEVPERLTLTTRFGLERPLERVLRGADAAVLRVPVTTGSAETTTMELGAVTYDGEAGELLIALRGNGLVDAELLVSEDEVLSGPSAKIRGSGTLTIPTPYLAPEALVGETHQLKLYYGSDAITQTKELSVLVEEPKAEFPTVLIIGLAAVTFIIVLVVVLLRRK